MRAYVGVGTNLGDRWRNLALAAKRLRSTGLVAIVRASRVWDTAPMGPPQPRFLNAVLELETRLPPRALLALLQRVEGEAHRRRERRWGPRTLDLDLLLHGDSVIAEPGLRVPHPGIAQRPFVLAPLAELAPDLALPGNGRTVRELLGAVEMGDSVALGRFPF
jgi:2-amino-4-hydroxy-6-hydroxymethyldihydropteridine diphosphokinase